MKPLNQEEFSMTIIEDLGMLLSGKTKNRFALFECIDCKVPFKVRVATAKQRQQEYCYSCQKLRQKEIAKATFTIHGKSGTRLHNIWKNMHNRCNNTSNTNYASYGGRGITVCDEWKDMLTFEKWALANGYNETLTIDRKDNNKSYFSGNCRWVSMKVQSNNRRQREGASSKHIGVSKTKYNTWKATITIDGKREHLGTFKTEEEAKYTRDARFKKLTKVRNKK